MKDPNLDYCPQCQSREVGTAGKLCSVCQQLTLNEFQKRCMDTAIYPDKGSNLPYTALGLCGESGEVAEKVKKLLRDYDGHLNEERRLAICKELGDVMWYVSATVFELGMTLQEVADIALEKYAGRVLRGTLHGDGDDR